MYCFGDGRSDDLLAARQPFALALAHLFALERDRLHALGQRIGREQRHRQA